MSEIYTNKKDCPYKPSCDQCDHILVELESEPAGIIQDIYDGSECVLNEYFHSTYDMYDKAVPPSPATKGFIDILDKIKNKTPITTEEFLVYKILI